MIRLDKFLSEMGIGTRTEVKKIIRSGVVTVNDVIEKKPELKIDIEKDIVCCRNKKIAYKKYEYYLLNKPAGCVSATEDKVHKTVMDFITNKVHDDLFPVGRLDIDTEGLLLITNDGALAHELLSPVKHVDKTYYALIEGIVTDEDVYFFEKGVDIGDGVITKPAELKILESKPISQIELTITEGKFHQVKRMFEAVGKRVVYLKRVSMGSLTLPDDLETGKFRSLTEDEIKDLKQYNKK